MKTKCGKRSFQKILSLTKDPKNLPLMPSLKKQARRFAIEATKKAMVLFACKYFIHTERQIRSSILEGFKATDSTKINRPGHNIRMY